MSSFTQTEPSPWPSGLGEVAAVIALSPEALAERYGLEFFEGSDNLDDYHAAVVRLESGRRLGLLRHLGNPSPGTEIHSDSVDDFVEAIREFLGAFELSADDLVWTQPGLSLGSWLGQDDSTAHAVDAAGRGSRDPRTIFLENLPWIEKVAGVVCRKHGVWGDVADDFASIVKMSLMENDYADLRKFRGEASETTYISTLVVRRFHEYSRERWGRWRNSAAAERQGQIAKELETLVHRDGYSLSRAAERLRSTGKTSLSDVELARILDRLPSRQPLRPKQVDTTQPENASSVMLSALLTTIEPLAPEERRIVRMRFADKRSVEDVAQALRLEQKRLHRRIDKLRAKLSLDLERAGVTAEDVREVLAE